jgi:hypothetical protein
MRLKKCGSSHLESSVSPFFNTFALPCSVFQLTKFLGNNFLINESLGELLGSPQALVIFKTGWKGL